MEDDDFEEDFNDGFNNFSNHNIKRQVTIKDVLESNVMKKTQLDMVQKFNSCISNDIIKRNHVKEHNNDNNYQNMNNIGKKSLQKYLQKLRDKKISDLKKKWVINELKKNNVEMTNDPELLISDYCSKIQNTIINSIDGFSDKIVYTLNTSNLRSKIISRLDHSHYWETPTLSQQVCGSNSNNCYFKMDVKKFGLSNKPKNIKPFALKKFSEYSNTCIYCYFKTSCIFVKQKLYDNNVDKIHPIIVNKGFSYVHNVFNEYNDKALMCYHFTDGFFGSLGAIPDVSIDKLEFKYTKDKRYAVDFKKMYICQD